MDKDIRDLLLDDDLFDPFDDEDEGEAVEVVSEDGSDDLIGAPLEERPQEEAPALPPEERIAKLLEEVPGQKRLMLRLVDYCREPKTGVEMDAYTEELQEHCYSVYSPVVLRELLEGAGAIEYLTDEDPQDAAAETVAASETGAADGEAGVLPAAAAEASADTVDPFACGALLVPIDEAKVCHDVMVEGDEEVVLDFLEVEERQPGVWVATAAGCAAVDAVDDVADTKELLGKEPQYLDIYHQILDYCAEEKYGRSAKEIDNLVNDSPLLQEPRRYSGYFVSRLERQGALEWQGGWCITKAGQAVIEDYEAQLNKEVCHG
ncbi:hypothetical protein PZH32_01970 [Adlercreutzia equolifaciens]|uniref:hypothetical protein n=1 Tax=Adlercreutzia equolifaciens TaxID=446660 RepID=UPI0023AFE9AA|nr:hypothetical protein [Adlercreutzia equolifaciens]MDE8701724.1 hypothetical protein [Adlercreutzia equolifaciens]